jgi:hypothetical protein
MVCTNALCISCLLIIFVLRDRSIDVCQRRTSVPFSEQSETDQSSSLRSKRRPLRRRSLNDVRKCEGELMYDEIDHFQI